MIYQNESQLIRTSDQIVYGKIVDVKSAWNAQKTHIETTAQILVDEAFVQSDTASINSGATIPVTILGGTVGDLTALCEDMPVFELDSNVFVYLEKTKSGKFTVHGLENGIHQVISDETGTLKGLQASSSPSTVAQFKEEIYKTLRGEPVDINPPEGLSKSLPVSVGAPGDPIISSISPSTGRAGIDTGTITGSGFGLTHASNGKVMFFKRLISYSAPTINWEYVYNNSEIDAWSDTQIQVKIPVGASSGFVMVRTDSSNDSNLIPFAVNWSYGRLKWASSPTYYVNPGSIFGFTTAIQNAATTWNDVTGTSFSFNYGGVSTKTGTAGDLTNDISVGPPEDFAAGVLALTQTYYYTGTDRIADCDVEFNPAIAWTTGTGSGNTYSVESVMTHEFGHCLKLKDLYGDLPQRGVPGGYPSDLSPELKMMFGISGDSYGNMNLKTLSSSDIAGIRWIYPGADSVPTVTSITPSFGANTGSVSITNLAGTNFANDAIVRLSRSGSANITATGVAVVSPTKITCTFTLTGTTPGHKYNVVVINPDGKEGVLANGFTIDTEAEDSIAIFRPSSGYWYFDYNLDGVVDKSFRYGGSTDQIIKGDWDGDGQDGIAIFRPSTGYWYFDYNLDGVVDKSFRYGGSTDQIIAGDWDSDGSDEIAIFRPSTGYWYFDYNLDGVVDKSFRYGGSTDRIIGGKWT